MAKAATTRSRFGLVLVQKSLVNQLIHSLPGPERIVVRLAIVVR